MFALIRDSEILYCAGNVGNMTYNFSPLRREQSNKNNFLH